MNKRQVKALMVLVALFGTGAIAMGRLIDAMSLQLEKKPIYPESGRTFLGLPSETPGWKRVGGDRSLSQDVVATLGTENYVSRVYERKEPGPNGQTVRLELHAAYYTDDIDTVPHVPERCFVGGGLQKGSFSRVVPLPVDTSRWRPDRSIETDEPDVVGESGVIYKVRTLPEYRSVYAEPRLPRNVGPESPIPFRVSEFERPGTAPLYAGYFFVANGRAVGNAEAVRLESFNIKNEYAYYAKVQTTSITGVRTGEQHAEYSGELIGELLPEIMLCVPDWVDVQLGYHDPAASERDSARAQD